MPNPKKPTELRVLQGTANRNKQRNSPNPPQVTEDIGEPPNHLGEQEKAIWNELKQNLYSGVLASGDRISLEIICRLIAEMRNDFENFQAAKITQLNSFLSKFGMTPSDRAKIVVSKQEEENPFTGM